MKIKRVEIENIRGIAKTSFAPHTLTVISGANGTGKSSVIDALKALVSSGHDPTLLRKGSESGRIIAVFDDGQSLTLTVTQQKTTRVVRDEKGRTISAPMSIINELTTAVSFDPLSFLEADEKQQAKWLLESLPITITPDMLKAAGIPARGADLSGHGLVVLETLHKQFYDERRTMSRDAKSKQSTISELQSGLPDPDTQIASTLESAELELKGLEAERSQAITVIDGQERQARLNANSELAEREAEIANQLRKKIDDLRRKAGADTDTARLGRDRAVSASNVKAAAARESAEVEYRGQIDAKREVVGSLKAKANEAQRAEGQRQAIAKMQREVGEIEVEIEGLNASLASIAKLKASLTSNLPIAGLEVADGRLTINGIPLSTVNSADKILDVALQVALLRMKELPFLVIDNGERLDAVHLGTLERIATEKGLQVVLSRVTDEPKLAITAEG